MKTAKINYFDQKKKKSFFAELLIRIARETYVRVTGHARAA